MSSITPSEEKDLPVAELLKRLTTTEKGLSSSEAAKRLQQYGTNEIAEKKRSANRFPKLFLGTHPRDDRSSSDHLRIPTELG